MQQRGIRKTSAVVTSPVTGAAVALYNITAGRSAVIKKIMWQNNCAANSVLSLGQGLAAAFAALMPTIMTINGMSGVIGELELPAVEFQNVPVIGVVVALTAITFESNVAGIDVQIEVEEIE